jgi:hypothetical protein
VFLKRADRGLAEKVRDRVTEGHTLAPIFFEIIGDFEKKETVI